MPKRELTPAEEILQIRSKLGHNTFERKTDYWLDTGSPSLNAVLGSRELGIPYKVMMEIFGWQSHGKTLLAMYLLGQAQADGADTFWVAAEDFDKQWAAQQGVDIGKLALFEPQLVGDPDLPDTVRMQFAQETMKEVEVWFKRRHDKKIFGVVDSVNALLPKSVVEAGVDGQTMHTNYARAKFFGELMPQWNGWVRTYNFCFLMINQIRNKTGMVFGNPEKTTGGDSIPFYCGVRARVHRQQDGNLKTLNQITGLRSSVANVKNKAGGGSVEKEKCEFLVNWDKGTYKFGPLVKSKKPDPE